MTIKRTTAAIVLIAGLSACDVAEQPPIEKEPVPDVTVISDVDSKKRSFFNSLLPAIDKENQRVENERSQLFSMKARLDANKSLTGQQNTAAQELANSYKLDINDSGVDLKWIDTMLTRVDVIPAPLILSQGANESAWGTSRFAKEGNNFFGQWCYSKGCGIVPSARNEGSTHEVASFANAQQSVHAYFMNVNRNRAYTELREIRRQLRVNDPDASEIERANQLANGLMRYSERGHEYVSEIQAMIRHNKKFWSNNA
ncbi:glucosaminidase domain-containing protein [Aliivibrio kagoshimensis]|uniref:glucosaminidase domain-containing protein n=1 Tax=Aliivibrio kagoshimensis TaxID=2910230 RepID=UPI003D0BEED4